ncbi:delta-aminolevulinic acid dehydratase [Streptomyces sp. BR123]|nr:delta-aminolevulinic acid dehydratase [Streptomyces sp. BR123]NXY93827.1 delta-aminolevulinic acid dehydratase [Streptomyces sp. BR123]
MGATPRSGRRAFQLDPGQPEQAVHTAREMVDEGADMILTEPALHTVDTLVGLRQKLPVPVMPFSVSGEYLRLTDPAPDGGRTVTGLLEAYTVLKRSGASRILTYGALDLARRLRAS